MKHSLLSLDDLYLYVSKAILLFLIVAQINFKFLVVKSVEINRTMQKFCQRALN